VVVSLDVVGAGGIIGGGVVGFGGGVIGRGGGL
jgi:hypothetical protein